MTSSNESVKATGAVEIFDSLLYMAMKLRNACNSDCGENKSNSFEAVCFICGPLAFQSLSCYYYYCCYFAACYSPEVSHSMVNGYRANLLLQCCLGRGLNRKVMRAFYEINSKMPSEHRIQCEHSEEGNNCISKYHIVVMQCRRITLTAWLCQAAVIHLWNWSNLDWETHRTTKPLPHTFTCT